MSDCQIIADLLPEYISKNTTREQNSEIAHHVSSCPNCRADFAFWLSVERSLQHSTKSIAAKDFQAMLNNLPDKETELEKILKTGSYKMAFDVIRYAFSTVTTTFRLASLLYGGE